MKDTRELAIRSGALALAVFVGAAMIGSGTRTAKAATRHGVQQPGIAAQRAVASDTGLSATLSGSEEVPGPGEEKGSGSFHATVNPAQNQVCYELTVDGLSDVTAAHIHEGDAGKSGPPVVPLKAPEGGSAKECATVKADVIAGMVKSPSHYYVNVHDKAYPGGAVRGQLALSTGM